jgi:hypothetical protein
LNWSCATTCAARKRPIRDRLLDYRQHIEPWQKQVEKLNALQPYQIREKTTFIEHPGQQISGVSIHLHIPILK